jgi:hypothetical protein
MEFNEWGMPAKWLKPQGCYLRKKLNYGKEFKL